MSFFVGAGLTGCQSRPAEAPVKDAAPKKSFLMSPEHGSPLHLAMSQSFLNRAVQFMEYEAYGPAIENFSDALVADPDNAKIFYMRASAYLRLGLLHEAIGDLSMAIETEGQSSYYLSRCGAYFATGRWSAAISDCTDTIQLEPMQKDAYLLRAMTHYSTGDLEKAIADALVVLMIHPNDPNARNLIEEVLQERERRERGYLTAPMLKTDMDGGR